MSSPSDSSAQDRPRIVVITGCTRGLGRALVDGFVSAGFTVAGCGTNAAIIGRMREEFPESHFFCVADVADEGSARAFAEAVLSETGTPDLFLNNAGVINAKAPLWEVPADEFSRVVDVNLKGVAAMIRHFAPAMIARSRGVFVNFSSGWGRSTSPHVAPYCATKWAIEGLSAALAQELPPGMASVALNPGVIDTEMLRSCFGSSADGYPGAAEWARKAVPFLAALGPKDNGKALTV